MLQPAYPRERRSLVLIPFSSMSGRSDYVELPLPQYKRISHDRANHSNLHRTHRFRGFPSLVDSQRSFFLLHTPSLSPRGIIANSLHPFNSGRPGSRWQCVIIATSRHQLLNAHVLDTVNL
jgi:hypothetical protein